jgi:hypothetical protein
MTPPRPEVDEKERDPVQKAVAEVREGVRGKATPSLIPINKEEVSLSGGQPQRQVNGAKPVELPKAPPPPAGPFKDCPQEVELPPLELGVGVSTLAKIHTSEETPWELTLKTPPPTSILEERQPFTLKSGTAAYWMSQMWEVHGKVTTHRGSAYYYTPIAQLWRKGDALQFVWLLKEHEIHPEADGLRRCTLQIRIGSAVRTIHLRAFPSAIASLKEEASSPGGQSQRPVTAAKPAESSTAPPFTDPFKDWPQEVELPPFGSQSRSVLARIHTSGESPWEVTLSIPPSILEGGGSFTIEPGPLQTWDGKPRQTWQVRGKVMTHRGPIHTVLAYFGREGDTLRFTWLGKVPPPEANGLRRCTLQVRAGGETKSLPLSKLLSGDSARTGERTSERGAGSPERVPVPSQESRSPSSTSR